MKIGDFNISIVNYLGKLDGGVLVLLNIIYNDDNYEATYWYNEEFKIVTLDKKLKEELQEPIENHKDYDSIIEKLSESCEDYDEAFERLEEYKI